MCVCARARARACVYVCVCVSVGGGVVLSKIKGGYRMYEIGKAEGNPDAKFFIIVMLLILRRILTE